MIALTIAAASALIWLYLLVLRGRFWAVRVPPVLPTTGPAQVVAVIPARNEVAVVGRTIESLLRQAFDGDLRIILVDDHSSDGTAEAARAAAGDQAARLTVLTARPLPAGWTGKLWAVSEGLALAATMDADFILLTDADIDHAPGNLAALVGRAQREELDLTSQMVLLNCTSLAERALIPAFVFFFFMLYPPNWVRAPGHPVAGAAGGCMLVRPAALERIGGIAAIRGALIDDCALAGAIKRSGGKIRLDVTEGARSTRAYYGAGEIWSMIARTAFTQLRYSTVLMAGTVLGLFLTYLAPPLFAILGSGWPQVFGITSYIGMAIAFQPTLRLYRLRPLWGFALPAIALFYLAATIGSAVNFWRGRGGMWKDRAQAAAGLPR